MQRICFFQREFSHIFSELFALDVISIFFYPFWVSFRFLKVILLFFFFFINDAIFRKFDVPLLLTDSFTASFPAREIIRVYPGYSNSRKISARLWVSSLALLRWPWINSVVLVNPGKSTFYAFCQQEFMRSLRRFLMTIVTCQKFARIIAVIIFAPLELPRNRSLALPRRGFVAVIILFWRVLTRTQMYTNGPQRSSYGITR